MPVAKIDPELSQRIEALFEQCRNLGHDWRLTTAEQLFEEADALAERSQSLGLPDLCEALLGLAAYVSSFAETAMRPTPSQLAQLATLADAVADALIRYRAQIQVAALGPSQQTLPPQPAIHYLGRVAAHGDLMRSRFASLGYGIVPCATVAEAQQAMQSGVVLALVLGADMLADWLIVHQASEKTSAASPIPLVVLSDHDLIDVRLAAMRCGAETVFVLPEDADRVAPRVAGLIADRSEPYRVLIVDDENSMRMFCDSVLRHNQLETRPVASPEEALLTLHEFTPDVILADLYMPHISGFELLALFRAHPRTAFTPVILLSGDEDAEKRFAALHIGGDDYLTKPIRPRHLVAAVTSRARRARWLRRELVTSR
jgi:DNA-binding response OmpR family regulator